MSTRWSRVALGKALRVRYGKAHPKEDRSEGAPFPVVGSAGVMGFTHTPLTKEPTVVIGRKGNVGQSHYIESGCWPTDTTYFVLMPDGVNPRFLTYQLEHLNLRRLDQSTTTPSLRREDLEAQLVVLPSSSEQRRIVDILEEHLSSLDAATAALGVAKVRSRNWLRSLVNGTIWGHGWPTARVADLLREPMRNGRSDRVSPSGDGVRTLTLTAVTQNTFTNEYTKITSTTAAAAEGLWLKPGDILVQRSNTPELVGTTARYSGPEDWAIFPDLLIRLRANESLVSSEFMEAALRSERTHRALRARAKGLAGSMPKIDQGTLGSTAIPVPDLDRQRQAFAQVQEAERGAGSFYNAVVHAERRAAALRRALLSAAFSGQLTGRSSDTDIIEDLADEEAS